MLLVYFPSVSLKYEPSPLTVMEHLLRGELTFLSGQLESPSSPRPHTCAEWEQCAGVCKGWQSDTHQLQEHLEDQDLGRLRSWRVCWGLFSLKCVNPCSGFQLEMRSFQNRERRTDAVWTLASTGIYAPPVPRHRTHVQAPPPTFLLQLLMPYQHVVM